jgi:DEAD/DEAH box helicase domain-containing protein
VEILIQHIKCAAFELPFEEGEPFRELAPAATADALQFLQRHEVVHAVPGEAGRAVFHWSTDAYPANHVSLRSVGWDNVVVIELGTDRVLAEMDFRSAHTMLHEQAIYQHDAEQYQVERLDLPNRKAFVRKVAPDYFTTALTHVKVSVIEEERRAPVLEQGLMAGGGEVSVVEKVVGFKKIKFHTHENVGYGEVALPELQLHTTALWLTVPEELVERIDATRPAVIDALGGIASALHTVACVGLMIDPRDLGRALGSGGQGDAPAATGGGALFNPTIFLYDHVPGGVGLAGRLFEQRLELLRRARRLIESCPCADGCPSCIGPVPGARRVDDELGARRSFCLAVMGHLGVTALQ